MQHLFTVEALLEHPKTKDHLQVSIGEVLFVLLLTHEKLPDGKYLVEKEDGTSEMECMTTSGPEYCRYNTCTVCILIEYLDNNFCVIFW